MVARGQALKEKEIGEEVRWGEDPFFTVGDEKISKILSHFEPISERHVRAPHWFPIAISHQN